MAKDAGVPVLLLAQLNRQSDVDQKPKLSHLRESGSIEQDADKVIFLYCEYASRELRDYASEYDTEAQQDLAMKRDQMKVKIAVEKNRQGRHGEVNAIFDKHYQNFVTQTPSFKKGETFETFFDKYFIVLVCS
jgi:replicative DNA helicase